MVAAKGDGVTVGAAARDAKAPPANIAGDAFEALNLNCP
jgi:hypothetical protein